MAPTSTGRPITTASLRAGVLDLGTRLGWDQPRVEAFARAVTGRPWQRCGRAELQNMLLAYAALVRRVRATWADCAAHPEEG
jgi:hypothetical protein